MHALYFILLGRGYEHGDLGLVYPIARGTGPLLVPALAIPLLGERRLAICGARHNQTMDRLHVPAISHELSREPIQESRMGRLTAVAAEVIHRWHDSLAEMPRPQMIDGDTRRQGVFLIDLRSDPVDGTPLSQAVPGLIRRIRGLAPEKIILIKATVYDAASAGNVIAPANAVRT